MFIYLLMAKTRAHSSSVFFNEHTNDAEVCLSESISDPIVPYRLGIS